jgi:calcineurin-like phosphoesterase
MIPLAVIKSRSIPARLTMALRATRATGNHQFSSQEIGKRINESTRTISRLLKFTSGVNRTGEGIYEFTGEMIEVQP